MTKQDMAKEILEVFFCACSESFDYSLQKQSTMDPGELMALPLMWVQHTHGNMLEDMLEVEFTPAPESRYGFKVHSVVIH